jgi:hypothetical protein
MRMKMHHGELEWPAWAPWTLLAIIITALITVVATINDIW